MRAQDSHARDRDMDGRHRREASVGVHGASVGDSEAWCRRDGEWMELTTDQRRKPLIGSGRAAPASFTSAGVNALFIASDGLVKYAKWHEIIARLEADGAELPRQLVDAARLPSGSLQDDLSIIWARKV